MHIAHLATSDFIVYYLLLPQLLAVRDAGHHSIAISAAGPFVERLEAEGIEHIELPGSTRSFDLKADLRAAKSLWTILRERDIDLLHTHNPKPGVYGRVVGRLAGVPAIVNTNHGVYASPEDPLLKKAIVYPLEAIAARFSDYELIQSVEDYELLTGTRITRPERTVLLGNGIDVTRFDPARFSDADRLAIRAELELDPNRPVVGIVARLVAAKGIHEFISAQRILGISHQFIVVGAREPEKSDAISEREIEEAEHAGVRFLGTRPDVDRILAVCDVFALPSYREGVPRAAMEAAASGVPIVASDIRGCRQVVDDARTGFLVPMRDPAMLAWAIDKITNDPVLSAAMGRAARHKAVTEFDQIHVLKTVQRTYAMALNGGRKRRRRSTRRSRHAA